jgi:plasmid replication initiation protein
MATHDDTQTKPRRSALDILKARTEEAEQRRKDKQADLFAAESTEPDQKSHLTPERHPQQDFFVADIFDANPKDDIASMEHPIFSLKAGDTRIRHYERNGQSLTVIPSVLGAATIHDKDLWIYLTSQLVDAMNQGRPLSKIVRITAYDFLVSTNRDTGGRAYKLMGDALSRLQGTMLETNIETAGYRERKGFGLIDSWEIIERDGDERMISIEVCLPNWLYRSIQNGQILTLSRDYFRLRKPLDRRVYELTRKHCGSQSKWAVSLTVLHEKTGSTANIREFRRALKSLVDSNELPDYRAAFDVKTDTVTFFSRDTKGRKAELLATLKTEKGK